MSLIPTISMSLRLTAALKARRPIRPNPLIPTLVIFLFGLNFEKPKINDLPTKTNEIKYGLRKILLHRFANQEYGSIFAAPLDTLAPDPTHTQPPTLSSRP